MNKNDRLTELKDKSMKMELYLYEQARDMFDLYYDSLKQTVREEGHIGVHEYLTLLAEMDEENMKDWEKMFMAEVRELRLIQDDVKALQQKL